MDVMRSEREKRIIRHAVTIARLKLGKKASVENIHNFLITSKCEAIREVTLQINKAANHIKARYQRKTVIELSEISLWFAYNHHVYRSILLSSLKSFTKYNTNDHGDKYLLSKLETIISKKLISFSIKKMGEQWTSKEIIADMNECTNETARYILDFAYSNIDDDSLYNLICVGLWICIRDTAYRDIFYYILHNIGNKSMKEYTKQHYKKPSDWYPNLWIEGKEITKKQRENHEIPEYEHSIIERQCVPEKHLYDLQQTLKKMRK